jgi:hypothetical protein
MNAVLDFWPLVLVGVLAAPDADDVTGFVELDHRRQRVGAV